MSEQRQTTGFFADIFPGRIETGVLSGMEANYALAP